MKKKLSVNKWDDYIIYGGDMPELDLPHVPLPEGTILDKPYHPITNPNGYDISKEGEDNEQTTF